VAPSWAEGANYIIQLTGIGGLAPNTVLLDWPENWRKNFKLAEDFVSILRTALAEDKAVLAVRGVQEMPMSQCFGTIDIWWMIHDGGFLILLAWLLVQHKVWRQCHLRVFTITEGVTAEQALTKTLREKRLFEVNVEVILVEGDTIEPYTHDWTLRVEDRRKFLAQLHGENSLYRGESSTNLRKESIPLEIDELFNEVEEEHKNRGLKRQVSEDDDEQLGQVAVSDFRKAPDGGNVGVAVHHKYSANKHLPHDQQKQEHSAGSAGPGGLFRSFQKSKGGQPSGSSSSADAPNDDGTFQLDHNDRAMPTNQAGPPRVLGPGLSKELGAGAASKVPHLQAEVGPMAVHLEEADAAPELTRTVSGGSFKGGILSAAYASAGEPDEEALAAKKRGKRKDTLHNWDEKSFEKLNQIIYTRSKRAQLVVMNLPDLWGNTTIEVNKFMTYCETLTKGLERLLFVHSSGHEVFDLDR